MIRFPLGARIWLLTAILAAVLVAVSFAYIDLPVAAFARRFSGALTRLGDGLGSAVLLSLEAILLLVLALLRIFRGHMSPLGRALALALLSSVCAYAVNTSVLKIFCGVPNPSDVMDGAKHSFHFAQGSLSSGFPSGHMMLAGAFAGVFMRLYRTSILPLALLLSLAAGLLIVGGWHFVSDVIAGCFLGVSVGLLAGEVWLEHEQRL